MSEVALPAAGGSEDTAVFTSRGVSPLAVARRFRRSILDVAPLFGDHDVISVQLGGTTWHIGRSPSWTRQVIGSRSMWADIDILPLGLAGHPDYYAMGGLPGAPPERHRVARRAAVSGGFAGRVDDRVIEAALAMATDLSIQSRSGVMDLALFARALFLRVTASAVVGIELDGDTIQRILGWFDRWTTIMSSPLVILGRPQSRFTPAGRLREVLGHWYGYLADLMCDRDQVGGLVAALRRQVDDHRITVQEAIGYLATILFAGTEPPAHTLLWAHAFIVGSAAVRPDDIDGHRADVLLWESLRVRPAVNVVVRRMCASDAEYRSASPVTYVVAPPLTHQRSNERHGLPATFRPLIDGPTRLDPDEYPGLGAGFHHCVGARLGMDVARQALLFLLRETTVVRLPDLAPRGVITTLPRRLPIIKR